MPDELKPLTVEEVGNIERSPAIGWKRLFVERLCAEWRRMRAASVQVEDLMRALADSPIHLKSPTGKFYRDIADKLREGRGL